MEHKIDSYELNLDVSMVDYLRINKPCLLNQMVGFGCEINGRNYHFYHQPENVLKNVQAAFDEKPE